MNWQQLTQNDKNKAIAVLAVLLAFVLYTWVFLPTQQRNADLQTQLQSQQELTQYLSNTKQQLALLPKHPVLTKQQAQQVIESLFKANKIKLNALIMQTDGGIISINKIAPYLVDR